MTLKNISCKVALILALALSTGLPVWASYIVSDGSITTAKLASGAVTGAKIASATVSQSNMAARSAVVTNSGSAFAAAGSVVYSNNCSGFSTTSATLVNVQDGGAADLVAKITTTGNPVFVSLETTDATGGAGTITGIYLTNATSANFNIQISRDGSGVGAYGLANGPYGQIPASAISFLDFAGAGTHSYKVAISTSTGTLTAANLKIRAYEIK